MKPGGHLLDSVDRGIGGDDDYYLIVDEAGEATLQFVREFEDPNKTPSKAAVPKQDWPTRIINGVSLSDLVATTLRKKEPI